MPGMLRELKVKAVNAGDITVEVAPTTTITELKAMLNEKKHGQDPIERQISTVQLLANDANKSPLPVDENHTVESAGLLHAESQVTVIYCQ